VGVVVGVGAASPCGLLQAHKADHNRVASRADVADVRLETTDMETPGVRSVALKRRWQAITQDLCHP